MSSKGGGLEDTAGDADRRLIEGFLNALGDPVFVKDDRHRFVFLNDRCVELVGRPRSELMGRSDHDFFPKEQADVFWERDDVVLASGELDINEETLSTPDGERILSTAKARFIDPASGRRYVIGTIRDVTERKRLERLVIEIGDAERRRVGQDLHDEVGQRLTGTSFLMQALVGRLVAQGSSEGEPAQAILAALRETIGALRDATRLLGPLGRGENDLAGALEELVTSGSNLLGLRCELECPAPFELGDASTVGQLYRIAQEAMTNAAKHADASKVLVSVRRQGGAAVMEVCDDGVGIAEEIVARPGLGLRIMRFRAALFGGSVKVERGEDGGTVVRCGFPL